MFIFTEFMRPGVKNRLDQPINTDPESVFVNYVNLTLLLSDLSFSIIFMK